MSFNLSFLGRPQGNITCMLFDIDVCSFFLFYNHDCTDMQSNPSMFIINTRGKCTFDTHNRRTVMLIMYLHMAAQTLVISFVEIGRVQIWIINLLYVAKYSFSSWISQCFLFTRLLIHFLLESLSILCSHVYWHFGSIFMWVLAYHCFQYTFCVSICQSFFFPLCVGYS